MAEQSFQAVIGDLQRIPGMIEQVRTGISALKSVADVGGAVGATGHPAMSAAIVGLGAEMIMFVLQCAEALKEDVEGVAGNVKGYEEHDASVADAANQGLAAVCAAGPTDGRLGGPEIANYTRSVLTAASGIDDYANGVAADYRAGSDAVQREVAAAGRTASTGGNQYAQRLDNGTAYLRNNADNVRVGDGFGESWYRPVERFAYQAAADANQVYTDVVRGGTALSERAAVGTVGALESVENGVDQAAHTVGTPGRRADSLLSVDTSAHRAPIQETPR